MLRLRRARQRKRRRRPANGKTTTQFDGRFDRRSIFCFPNRSELFVRYWQRKKNAVMSMTGSFFFLFWIFAFHLEKLVRFFAIFLGQADSISLHRSSAIFFFNACSVSGPYLFLAKTGKMIKEKKQRKNCNSFDKIGTNQLGWKKNDKFVNNFRNLGKKSFISFFAKSKTVEPLDFNCNQQFSLKKN